MIQSREKGLCWDLFTGNNQDTKKQKEEVCKIIRGKILTVPDKSKLVGKHHGLASFVML